MANTNSIGDYGETVFKARLTKFEDFIVYFLGDKAPIEDFMCEILDEQTPYQFLVQVKSTTSGYQASGNLDIGVDDDKLLKLQNRPLPTYLAGVDTNTERVYICPAFRMNGRYPSIPVSHKLDLNDELATKATLALLKQDIIHFWQTSNILNHKSNFVSAL